jgi:germination protein M
MRAHQRQLAVLVVLGALLAGLAACGSDKATTSSSSGSTTSTLSTSDPAATTEVRAYFMRGEKVGPVARTSPKGTVAAGALEGLLAGPTAAEQALGFSSAVPAGTKLNGVVITDRVATVDLSAEFASGGGSASMKARVAQVVFTVTQFPTVDGVSFKVDGAPITTLGGEGLSVATPQTRAGWDELSPLILVESPLPSATVTVPLQVTGTANTFEAAFRVTLTDSGGHILYDKPAMATSGSGTRGTFDVTAAFDISGPTAATLTVFEVSAENGSRINSVEIPLQLST